MPSTVTVRHNFETAHRLPHLPGKCQSLHGHSWWVDIEVTAPTANEDGIVVEFGPLKAALREWIDDNLDHGTMLGPDDPLIDPLREEGCKVYILRPWPTVENVARHLHYVARAVVDTVDHVAGTYVSGVTVRETHVNEAGWRAP